MFFKHIRYRVGKGDKSLFWTDLWVGDAPLVVSFPNLYNCASNQNTKVTDYMERTDNNIVWDPIFRINLNEMEAAQFRSMIILSDGVFIPKEGRDRRVWLASTDVMVLVTSLFLSMTREAMASHPQLANLWKIKLHIGSLHSGGQCSLVEF